jgi:hypothetical protein
MLWLKSQIFGNIIPGRVIQQMLFGSPIPGGCASITVFGNACADLPLSQPPTSASYFLLLPLVILNFWSLFWEKDKKINISD